jgi:hypothetical protein
MAEQTFKVYVIQGRNPRDFSDCQAALASVPAQLESLPFTRQEDEIIERTRDADALIVSSSPMTRWVMSALKHLKVVVRTGVGYDVIDVPAATDLGIVASTFPISGLAKWRTTPSASSWPGIGAFRRCTTKSRRGFGNRNQRVAWAPYTARR